MSKELGLVDENEKKDKDKDKESSSRTGPVFDDTNFKEQMSIIQIEPYDQFIDSQIIFDHLDTC